MSSIQTKKRGEEGIVAILVTMIIMIVLSLIVTGFAQLARREQREALDNQLNTQAFYAAESGINDAYRALRKSSTASKSNCGPFSSASTVDFEKELSDNKVSADGNVQYSCLLIKRIVPETLNEASVDRSTTIPMTGYNADGSSLVDVNSMTFNWTEKDGTVDVRGGSLGDLPKQSAWGTDKIGILRVDIIPMPTPGPGVTMSPESLSDNRFTFFAYPQNGGAATHAYGSANNGQILQAACSAGDKCSITINNLPTAAPYGSMFYVRLKAIYNDVTIKTCFNACDGTTPIGGAQAEIDSTGKASDVLKRIKVRVPDPGSTETTKYKPEFPLDTKDAICKQLDVLPAVTTDTGLCNS